MPPLNYKEMFGKFYVGGLFGPPLPTYALMKMKFIIDTLIIWAFGSEAYRALWLFVSDTINFIFI